jgi:hypothetical protein
MRLKAREAIYDQPLLTQRRFFGQSVTRKAAALMRKLLTKNKMPIDWAP